METYSEMALSTLPISLLCSMQTTTKRRGKVTGPLLLRVAFSFKKCLAYVLYRPNASCTTAETLRATAAAASTEVMYRQR